MKIYEESMNICENLRNSVLLLGRAGCCWLPLAAAGCCWLLLVAAHCCCRLLAAAGCCWLLQLAFFELIRCALSVFSCSGFVGFEGGWAPQGGGCLRFQNEVKGENASPRTP